MVALALTLALTLIVAAGQMQVATQLGTTRQARDYERALQMAEAGMNAYLNQLSNGFQVYHATLSPEVPRWMPAANPLSGALPTVYEFKTQVQNGTIPAGKLYYFPTDLPGEPNQKRQGFYVGHYASGEDGAPGATPQVVAYGFSNGIVRRVKVAAMSYSIFDWAAIYALAPNTSNNDPAWSFSGAATVIGACGGEGYIKPSTNVTWRHGPIILAAQGDMLNPPSRFDPTVVDPVVTPSVRRFRRPLDIETADQAANEASGTSSGVEYYRTNNNNKRGLRYLVRNTTTGVIRELDNSNDQYEVIPTTGQNAWVLSWPSSNDARLTAGGIRNGEAFFAIRAYPGHYFMEAIQQSNNDVLYLRTYEDGQRPTDAPIQVYQSDGVTLEPMNPNSRPMDKNVRFWMGNPASGNSPNTRIRENCLMEDFRFASRFRIYSASRGSITVGGNGSGVPFRVNMLAYNFDSKSNQFVGDVSIATGTHLFGSLIGWKISVAGGCTIEKQAREAGDSSDRLTYRVISWTELR